MVRSTLDLLEKTKESVFHSTTMNHRDYCMLRIYHAGDAGEGLPKIEQTKLLRNHSRSIK